VVFHSALILTHSPLQFKDILSRKTRRKIMYDDSDLAVSELYFFISQMLRFASAWIQESIDDLHALKQHIESKHLSPEEKKKDPQASFLPDDLDAQAAVLEVFRQNWESLTSTQRKFADKLFARINRMQEEVKTLREGVRSRRPSVSVRSAYATANSSLQPPP
jgi:hypothetical protein